nr:retrovirus-related Pol polyprotein from transposon TNT 1-94 [Tanacetum cinerariifolium]
MRYHAHTASLMEGEAMASYTAWAQSMDASDAACSEEKVYVNQPDGFVGQHHPNKVYRLKKALYGLKQAPKACVDTPIATKPLDADLSVTPVDQTKYRSMVGTLMYFTASKPDIVHATCYCARYQVIPTENHLKEECTSMSSVESEYVSLSACCAQVLRLRTQLTDYGFHFDKIPMYYDSKAAIAISCNPVHHSLTKHINVRYHFIKEQVEKRGVGGEEVIVGEGVVVISSSLDMLTNSCLGGIMVSLIFLEGLDEEAFVEFMVEWCGEDEDDDRNKDDDLFNYGGKDQVEKHESGGGSGMTTSSRAMILSRFFFLMTLIASSSSKSSSTKGDVLEGRGVSSNVLEDTVISNSEDSTITYTAVSSPFGGSSDIGSPRVGGPPVMPEDPYAYVVAAFQAPPSPDYVPGPEYPPSPGFVQSRYTQSSCQQRIIYFLLRSSHCLLLPHPLLRDERDDEDESSDDDEDDDIDIEGDEEEDEYLTPAESTTVALPAIDHASSAEETEPFETDESAATPSPHPAYRVTARMFIIPQTPISLSSDTEIARLMAIPTPPPLPLSQLSSPLPHIPSPPLPLLSPPPTDPTYEDAPLGYRVARLRGRAEREENPESSAVAAARHKEPVRGDLYRFMDTVERREGSTSVAMEVGYGITDTWDDLDDQALQRARVNRLFRDRRFHAHTARIIEGEAKASRTAWTQSMDASDAARSGVIVLGIKCTRHSHCQL